jgi:hypothetical protein
MIRADAASATGGARHDLERAAPALDINKWLALAATPIFAVMALLTSVLSGDSMALLCSAGHGSPLDGMMFMYLLMSAFHSAPWLKLISSRRTAQTSRSGLRTASVPPL